jgi:hypothetical protein
LPSIDHEAFSSKAISLVHQRIADGGANGRAMRQSRQQPPRFAGSVDLAASARLIQNIFKKVGKEIDDDPADAKIETRFAENV